MGLHLEQINSSYIALTFPTFPDVAVSDIIAGPTIRLAIPSSYRSLNISFTTIRQQSANTYANHSSPLLAVRTELGTEDLVRCRAKGIARFSLTGHLNRKCMYT